MTISEPKPHGLAASKWNKRGAYQAKRQNGDSRAQSQPPASRSNPDPLAPSNITQASPALPSSHAGSAHPNTAAPATTSTIAATRTLNASQALHRFEQICRRLRWKRIDLQNSYQRALAPDEHGFEAMDAERNFKVDFHEFYVWIEQAIVLVLCVFGVSVTQTWDKAANGGGGNHKWHHDVLRTVEEDTGPVGQVLGRADPKDALWKAKDLRNRWKGVHVVDDQNTELDRREGPPLRMYDLDWLMTQILGGLEKAYVLAQQRVSLDKIKAEEAGKENIPDNEEGYGWMVESMDWAPS